MGLRGGSALPCHPGPVDLFRHLRFFVAVAEEGHFGDAAARLEMTQPPVSQGLRRLEKELGVQLIRRTSRGAELTDAGRDLLPRARLVDDTLLEQHWATWAATNPQPLPDDPLRDVLFDADGRLKPLAVIVAENNQDANGGPTVGEDTLSKAVADRLRAQGMDLGSYDTTYNRYAGDDDNALSAEEYENELLGK